MYVVGEGGWWSCVAREMLCIHGNTSHSVQRVRPDLSHLFLHLKSTPVFIRLHTDFSAHNKCAPDCVSVFISISGLLGIIGYLMKI